MEEADAATLTIFPEIDVIASAGQRIVMAAQRAKMWVRKKAVIGLEGPPSQWQFSVVPGGYEAVLHSFIPPISAVPKDLTREQH